MNLSIFPNAEHISQKRNFNYQPKDLEDAKDIINRVGELLQYSDDYTAVIYVENKEFDTVIDSVILEMHDPTILNDAVSWRLFFTLKGMLICVIIDTENERVTID